MTTFRQFRIALIAMSFATIIGLMSFLPSEVMAQCPSPEKIQEGFQNVFKREVKVLKVQPSAISGVCEVVVSVSGRKGVFYSDSTGSYFVTGQIWDVQNKQNLTQEVMMSLNRLTPEEMKQLEPLAAFTLGDSGKRIYFATDPQCGYCKKALQTLKKLVDEKKLTVKVLLYPLAMHKEAEKECVSIICDNKGLKGLEEAYKSDNQCPEGVKKVKDTVAFLEGREINGTPVYIFPDGTYHMGLLPENVLLKKLGLEIPQETKKPAAPKETTKSKEK